MLKFNPELPCIRVNNSKSSLLSADDAEFFFLSPPPRSISVHAASLHFPAGFSAAKSRGFPKLPYSRECTRVSPSLSRSFTGAIMKRAPPTTYPSPLPPLFLHSSRNSRAKNPCPSRETYLPLNISVRAR